MDSLVRTLFLVSAPAWGVLAGCSSKPAVDPAQVAKWRSELTLTEEPDGVQTVSEVRMAMLGEAPPDVLSLIEEEGADHPNAEHEHAAGEEHAAEHDDPAATDAHAGEEHPPGEQHRHPNQIVEEMDVVLVGVVGGIPNPSEQSQPEFPFAPGQAMFFLADPEAVAELEEHSHQHAPGEECAFCAAHAADAMQLLGAVQFADKNGKVIPVDARELFDLKENETVVVKGKARVKSGGILSVDATGLYVRR